MKVSQVNGATYVSTQIPRCSTYIDLVMMRVLAVLVLLLLLRGERKVYHDDTGHAAGDLVHDANMWQQPLVIAAAASISPLSGTKQVLPWGSKSNVDKSNLLPAGYSNIPTPYDVFGNTYLTKLLDVGACFGTAAAADSRDVSYVPPLDGTNPDQTLCQNEHGMRFVLFDLHLVDVAEVDAFSGTFKAQLQLVFHWMEGWEQWSNVSDGDFYVYTGSPIETADNASTCGFECDTTSAARRRCCDRMWIPQLQIPTCKINDLQSIVPPPYLRTPEQEENVTSFWDAASAADHDHIQFNRYSARRTWYVGLDVTCPFTPVFRNFPYDYNFLTIDIVKPYSSRTWLQLNKGFLDANIIDAIAGIDLNPDDKIDGWRIIDVMVSSACGTQETWKPTFLTQDYLLQILGVDYVSQNASIEDMLDRLTCAPMKDLNIVDKTSFSNPTNKLPYDQVRTEYLERLRATITRYGECNRESKVEFMWNGSVSNASNLPRDIRQFNVNDPLNINRSFNFLDFQFQQDPSDGINFRCVIEAVANLTKPGIRINIITQRYKMYYWVKLIMPTCACVAFAFLAFGLKTSDLLGRLAVIVPSAIALSTLQGFVVSTDIPAISYIASTTWVVLSSYGMQLLIAIESIGFKFWDWRIESTYSVHVEESQNLNQSIIKSINEEKIHESRRMKIWDIFVGINLFFIYVGIILLLLLIPLHKSRVSLESRKPIEYESIWGKNLFR